MDRGGGLLTLMPKLPSHTELQALDLRCVVCYVLRTLRRLEPDLHRLKNVGVRHGVATSAV